MTPEIPPLAPMRGTFDRGSIAMWATSPRTAAIRMSPT